MGDDNLNAAPVSRSVGMPDIGTELEALWQLASVARARGGDPGTVLTERAERAPGYGFDLGATTPTHASSLVAEIRSQLQLATALAEGRSTPGWNPQDLVELRL